MILFIQNIQQRQENRLVVAQDMKEKGEINANENRASFRGDRNVK